MNAEFLFANYLNTTTLATVASGSTSVNNLLDRESSSQYQSSGYNDDTSGVTITVVFASSKNIDHILLQNCNFKGFIVYYNSNAANTFTPLGADTSTSQWTGNSDTSKFIRFATTSVDSISIVCTTTIAANEEKKLGELWVSGRRHIFDYNPAAKDYKPKIDRKEFIHSLANGGTVVYRIADKYRAKLKLKYVDSTERDSLRTLYDAKTDMVYIPFPTGTSWNSEVYQINWVGDFDFITPAANNWNQAGWSGSIDIREVP